MRQLGIVSQKNTEASKMLSQPVNYLYPINSYYDVFFRRWQTWRRLNPGQAAVALNKNKANIIVWFDY
jgi:hypothetical protein